MVDIPDYDNAAKWGKLFKALWMALVRRRTLFFGIFVLLSIGLGIFLGLNAGTVNERLPDWLLKTLSLSRAQTVAELTQERDYLTQQRDSTAAHVATQEKDLSQLEIKYLALEEDLANSQDDLIKQREHSGYEKAELESRLATLQPLSDFIHAMYPKLTISEGIIVYLEGIKAEDNARKTDEAKATEKETEIDTVLPHVFRDPTDNVQIQIVTAIRRARTYEGLSHFEVKVYGVSGNDARVRVANKLSEMFGRGGYNIGALSSDEAKNLIARSGDNVVLFFNKKYHGQNIFTPLLKAIQMYTKTRSTVLGETAAIDENTIVIVVIDEPTFNVDGTVVFKTQN